MTSSDDETGPEGSRHRSSEPRISRWRRRHADEEVGELDPDEVAELLRRAALADREGVEEGGPDSVQRAEDGYTADRRVFSDALEMGLADPNPPDKRHLLPRRRHEGERPVAGADEPADGGDRRDTEALLRDAQERIDEYAAKLRHARADVAAADDRARSLADELAVRTAEGDERVRVLAAERDAAEGRVRALTQAADTAAEERAALERMVDDRTRKLEEVQQERARAEELNDHHTEQLRQAQADLEQAEARAHTLAMESAARATEHDERVRALAAERDAVEERVRALTRAEESAAEERANLEQVVADRTRTVEEAQEECARLERVIADQARMLEEAQLELSRSREEIDRTAEHLRQIEADLEQAEQRSRTLATETAARATEHSERVRALVAEREAAEERARALAEEARAARAEAEATAAEYAARLEEAGSASTASDDEIAALKSDLAAAEERIRALGEDAAERNTLHAERVDALLADLAAVDEAAEEARRMAQQAEARMLEVQAEAQQTVEQRTAALSEAHQALAEAHALAGEQAQARAAAEERVAALERRLDEAHVLPVYSPVEAVTPQEEAPVVQPEPEPEPEPEVDEPEWEEPEVEEPEVEEPEVEEPEPEPEPASTRVARTAPASYTAKRGSGPIGVLAGLIALVCAAAVGWLAYQGTMLDRVGPSVALTVGAVLALGIALRRRAQSSEVHLERGTLRLRFGDNHHTFYLNSPSTRLEMTGQPGDRDWKMQVLRRGMAPVTIDAKDVDPVAFTEALQQWRPPS